MPTIKRFGRTLDARPDRLDLRDREFEPHVVSLPHAFPSDQKIKEVLPKYEEAGLILDQGEEGACTGFGLACTVNYLFFRELLKAQEENGATKGAARKRTTTKGAKTKKITFDTVSPRMLYHLARFYDEWPGEDYDGSSCRGALKAWHKHGVTTEKIWPYRDKQGNEVFVAPADGWQLDAMRRRLGVYYRVDHRSVVDMQAAIFQIGAVYVSSDVHDGWDLDETTKQLTGHAALPHIGKKKGEVGGHAFALVGYNTDGFVVQNSWGTTWGNRGFAVLPYEDWVKYGTDAWVCALGVPAEAGQKSPPMVLASPFEGRASERAAAAARLAFFREPATTRPKVPPPVSAKVAPWPLERAYEHTIVMGNEGRVINRIVTHASGAEGVAQIAKQAVIAGHPKTGPVRLLIYAHGGLNSEEASLSRNRVLAPYFAANGIYPLFLTWRTGPVETLTSILEDELIQLPRPEGRGLDLFDKALEAAADALDRTIEVLAGPAARPVWAEMKQNAASSTGEGKGSALLAAALAELSAELGADRLELHLVGHSAGSILLGQLLGLMGKQGLKARTCTLYAPACTTAFALEHYATAVKFGTLEKKHLHVHVLSDEREREDTVGPYRKSLLYLVSRALETAHKMPLLGMAEAFNSSKKSMESWGERERKSVSDWQKFWDRADKNLTVLEKEQVSTGTKGRFIRASHGCFDNDAQTIRDTMKRILGGAAPKQEVENIDF
jgi:hypothetical protein